MKFKSSAAISSIKKYLFAFIAFVVIGPLAYSQSNSALKWPEINQENKPWTRWWWEGSAVNPKDLSWIMEKYQEAGLGGLEITSIYGVKGYESEFVDFLSPEWMDNLQHTLKEGKRLNLGIDMAQASGWPFGGPWITDDEASKYISYKKYSVKGGESLTEKVSFYQEPLLRIVGEKIDISQLKEPIAQNPNLQGHAFDQVRFGKYLPLQTLMAYSESGDIVDLTERVDKDGNLSWSAPMGSNYDLYAVFQGWHGKMVERAGPGGEGLAIDHFSKEATMQFLGKFDEAFKGHDLSYLRCFFNDSYEVDDAQGEANWTPKMFDEFISRRGYDLRKHLPALFGKDNEETNQRVLCDYRETISDLLLENYTKTWKSWSAKYGKKIRNQAHGSPANILDLYAATDIPETEGEDVLRIKFASSAANVMGKPLVSSESATWENEHFLSSLASIKTNMDRYILGGVNHTFYHGANYTPKDAPWPGWLFYAAVHFTPNNPFWEDFSKLNEYMSHVQSFMQQGKPANDILLYLPIYDAFSKPGKTLLQHFDGIEHGFAGTSLKECAEFLNKNGYSFDFISDKQIQNATTSQNDLITEGATSYKMILIPETKYISLATFQKLLDLAEKGAQILFYKNLPEEVQGFAMLEERQEKFKKLQSSLNFTINNDIRQATHHKGSIKIGTDLDGLLKSSDVAREAAVDMGIQVVKRKVGDAFLYFATNQSNKTVDGFFPFSVDANSVAIFNPMSGKTGYANMKKSSSKAINVHLQMGIGESLILRTSKDQTQLVTFPYTALDNKNAIELSGDWTIVFEKGGPTLPNTIKTSKLSSWTEMGDPDLVNFSGTAKYTTNFKKPKGKGKWMLDLGNVAESASVVLNGNFIGTCIGPDFKFPIEASSLKRKNKLEIKVTNSMANRIIYMDKNKMEWRIFYNINMPSRLAGNRDKNGLFTSLNWSPKPSGLLSNVSLIPFHITKE